MPRARQALRFVGVVMLASAGCHCSHVRSEDDGGVPSDAATPVTGCDDPALWASDLPRAEADVELGGGPCDPAQYPLHRAVLSWQLTPPPSAEERGRYERSCWRVVDASEGSGWAAGEVFASEEPYGLAMVRGFERTVRFEGRVIRDDDTPAFAVSPGDVTLDPAMTAGTTTEEVVAILGTRGWASPDALHLGSERIATEAVVDGTSTVLDQPVVLHRGPTGYTLRYWSLSDGAVSSLDLALGNAEQAVLASGGAAVALDSELLLIGVEGGAPAVAHRVALPAPPEVLIGRYYYVAVQVPGTLLIFQRSTGELSGSLEVGEGTLLATDGDHTPLFFDGESFAPLSLEEGALGLDAMWRFRPAPEHLAALGAPLAVAHGIVVGENGFVAGLDQTDPAAGPRLATAEDLFGGGRITHLSPDAATYAVAHTGGTTFYAAPYVEYCD